MKVYLLMRQYFDAEYEAHSRVVDVFANRETAFEEATALQKKDDEFWNEDDQLQDYFVVEKEVIAFRKK